MPDLAQRGDVGEEASSPSLGLGVVTETVQSDEGVGVVDDVSDVALVQPDIDVGEAHHRFQRDAGEIARLVDTQGRQAIAGCVGDVEDIGDLRQRILVAGVDHPVQAVDDRAGAQLRPCLERAHRQGGEDDVMADGPHAIKMRAADVVDELCFERGVRPGRRDVLEQPAMLVDDSVGRASDRPVKISRSVLVIAEPPASEQCGAEVGHERLAGRRHR